MPRFKVTLTTVAEITVEVDATDEDHAIDQAVDAAKEFGDQHHAGPGWVVDVNNEWQQDETRVEEI